MMTHTQNSLLRTARKALICAPAIFLFTPALAHAAPAAQQATDAQLVCEVVQISATQTVTVCETKRESTRTIMTGADAQWSRANTAQTQQAPKKPAKRKTWTTQGRAHQA